MELKSSRNQWGAIVHTYTFEAGAVEGFSIAAPRKYTLSGLADLVLRYGNRTVEVRQDPNPRLPAGMTYTAITLKRQATDREEVLMFGFLQPVGRHPLALLATLDHPEEVPAAILTYLTVLLTGNCTPYAALAAVRLAAAYPITAMATAGEPLTFDELAIRALKYIIQLAETTAFATCDADVTAGKRPAWPPPGPVPADDLLPPHTGDRALFWLRVGQLLWQPSIQNEFGPALLNGPAVAQAELLAIEAWLVDPHPITVAGVELRVPDEWDVNRTLLWSLPLTLTLDNADTATVRYLTHGQTKTTSVTKPPVIFPDDWDEARVSELRQLAIGLTTALLRAAQTEQQYVPHGRFYLPTPVDHPLRTVFNLKGFRVQADATGMWVTEIWPNYDALEFAPDGHEFKVITSEMEVAFRWRVTAPHVWFWAHGQTGLLHDLVNVTLAGLWHDLCVAGPASVPSDRPRRATPTASDTPRHDKPTVRVLPRRAPAPSPVPGPDAEETASPHGTHASPRLHAVCGHLRRLTPGRQASATATTTAGDYGLAVLPDGYTFVQPHLRGQGGTTADGDPLSPTVRASGVETVTLLLQHKPKRIN